MGSAGAAAADNAAAKTAAQRKTTRSGKAHLIFIPRYPRA
jgi:hypothetical protein